MGPGERIALVGPNGSGKTTLMRALMGLLRVRGEVRVGGYDPRAVPVAALSLVAYVPQRAPALAATVGQMMDFWCRTRRLPSGDLMDVASRFDLATPDLARIPFQRLSGGMQQKLLVSMALASRCPALLFDEPTANLDPLARRTFLGLLAEARPAPTLVLSSHRLEEVRALVRRVVVLVDGTLLHDAPLDVFLADPDLAAAAGMDLDEGGACARPQRSGP